MKARFTDEQIIAMIKETAPYSAQVRRSLPAHFGS